MTPLEQFIADVHDITSAENTPDDEALAMVVGTLLQELVAQPYAVPAQFAQRSSQHGGRGRYILHREPSFTVSSIVWAPGEVAAPHTHETWGAIGLVTNGIEERRYEERDDHTLNPLEHERHDPGAVSLLVPDDDIHSMHNLTLKDTVEIHVYGKDLTGLRRRRWSLDGHDVRDFVSDKYFNC